MYFWVAFQFSYRAALHLSCVAPGFLLFRIIPVPELSVCSDWQVLVLWLSRFWALMSMHVRADHSWSSMEPNSPLLSHFACVFPPAWSITRCSSGGFCRKSNRKGSCLELSYRSWVVEVDRQIIFNGYRIIITRFTSLLEAAKSNLSTKLPGWLDRLWLTVERRDWEFQRIRLSDLYYYAWGFAENQNRGVFIRIYTSLWYSARRYGASLKCVG